MNCKKCGVRMFNYGRVRRQNYLGVYTCKLYRCLECGFEAQRKIKYEKIFKH